MNSMVFMLLLQVALIFCNAVFACAEIAVISMNDTKLMRLAEQGDKRAVRLSKLTRQPARFLATIQVAITLSGFIGSAFAADNFSDPLVELLLGLGIHMKRGTLDTIAVLVITLILSYLTLVFGELVPKRIAMRKAEKMALQMSSLVSGISKLFAPIVWLLTASTNGVLRLFGIDPNQEDDQMSEEEIRMLLEEGRQRGVIDQDENDIIQNVFEFNDTSAQEIATHRKDMVVLWLEDNVETWENCIRSNPHTYYPVCEESVDDIIGILDSKLYYRLHLKKKTEVIKQAIRAPYFVPETIRANVLFQKMKEAKNYFAVVIDEYGGVDGIVTMNDLIEQLLGDFITQQPGEQKEEIRQIDDHTWELRGSALIGDIEEELDCTLPKNQYDTFNGLIFEMLGKVPDDGSHYELDLGMIHISIKEVYNHKVLSAIASKKDGK